MKTQLKQIKIFPFDKDDNLTYIKVEEEINEYIKQTFKGNYPIIEVTSKYIAIFVDKLIETDTI